MSGARVKDWAGTVSSHNGSACARRLVLALFGLIAVILLVLATIPQEVVPPEYGLLTSLIAMASCLALAQLVARVVCPVRRFYPAAVFGVAAIKLALGLWYWDQYMYSLADQNVRVAFAASDIYFERAADAGVIDQLLDLFDRFGVQYFTSGDAELSINNRAPAHLAALVVRAFGGQYAAYFPFAAFLAALASMALLAALDRPRMAIRNYRAGVLLAILWPGSWLVCSVMKDSALYAFATMCAAYLAIASRNSGVPIGILLATLLLPLFRPVYFVVCAVVAAVWLVKSRASGMQKVVGVGGALTLVAVLAPYLDTADRLEGYRTMEASQSVILEVPVLGRVLYGLMTPFPWSQAIEVWWKYPYIAYAATGWVVLALLIAAARSRDRSEWRGLDYGGLLAIGMIVSGMLSRNIQPSYVQVGAAGLVPFALQKSDAGLRPALWMSFIAFAVANLVWTVAR